MTNRLPPQPEQVVIPNNAYQYSYAAPIDLFTVVALMHDDIKKSPTFKAVPVIPGSDTPISSVGLNKENTLVFRKTLLLVGQLIDRMFTATTFAETFYAGAGDLVLTEKVGTKHTFNELMRAWTVISTHLRHEIAKDHEYCSVVPVVIEIDFGEILRDYVKLVRYAVNSAG